MSRDKVIPLSLSYLSERQALTQARKIIDEDGGAKGLLVIWADEAGHIRTLSGRLSKQEAYWLLACVQQWIMEGCQE